MTDWPSYNRSLARRGEILFSHGFLDEWDTVLAKMNESKKGNGKSVYPESFFLVVGHVRICLHLPYGQTEGIIKATGKNLPSHPGYGRICKRVNKLNDGSTGSGINKGNSSIDGNDLVIAVDSSGIKTTNRGQWITDKRGAHNNNNNKKKGHLKVHTAVNTKTRETLALEVADGKAHDGKEMKALVERVLEGNKGFKIKTVMADGAYDGNENFKYLQEKKVQSAGIKVRKNSIITHKNNKMRNGKVRNQTRDLLKRKRKRGYGKRWMAKETAFSPIKRTCGEHVSATKFQNMVKGMLMKVSLHNLVKRLA